LLNRTPIKIAVVGPESTGKSTLTSELAAYFECPVVPEIARIYLETCGAEYTAEIVEHIARLQIEAEEEAIKNNPNAEILVCDTNLLVIKVWMEHAYGYCPEWIKESLAQYDYSLTFLTDIDIPWEPDLLREHPDKREYFMSLYKDELIDFQVGYHLISGNREERLKNAVYLVKRMLN